MKSLASLIAITTTAISLAAPVSVGAQSAISSPGIERIPLGGFYSTTTYTPSPDNVTTTVKTQIGVGDSSFPNATANYDGSTERYRNDIPYQQPIVIYQNGNYPRAILTRCILKTLDKPTRTKVTIDRYTGKPCG